MTVLSDGHHVFRDKVTFPAFLFFPLPNAQRHSSEGRDVCEHASKFGQFNSNRMQTKPSLRHCSHWLSWKNYEASPHAQTANSHCFSFRGVSFSSRHAGPCKVLRFGSFEGPLLSHRHLSHAHLPVRNIVLAVAPLPPLHIYNHTLRLHRFSCKSLTEHSLFGSLGGSLLRHNALPVCSRAFLRRAVLRPRRRLVYNRAQSF
jgi:hypothetical protein